MTMSMMEIVFNYFSEEGRGKRDKGRGIRKEGRGIRKGAVSRGQQPTDI